MSGILTLTPPDMVSPTTPADELPFLLCLLLLLRSEEHKDARREDVEVTVHQAYPFVVRELT